MAAVALAPVTPITESDAAPLSLSRAITRYAPHVYLHPDEDLLPMRPKDFINASSLRWNHDEQCSDHGIDGAGEGEIDPKRLGRGDYPAHSKNHPSPLHPVPFCDHEDNSYRTNDHTRPFDTLGAEGFFLDFKGDRNGSGLNVPVYYEYDPNAGANTKTITYWFFCAYNNFDVPDLPNQAHEGDWERITVRLNSENRATAVAFWNHDGYCTRSWSRVLKTKVGGHPVVFSALGSHASYPGSGDYKIEVNNLPDQVDRTKRSSKKWLTWRSTRSVHSPKEGWYGYGGAWGSVDGPGPVGHKDFSGPLGPSRYKNERSSVGSWDKDCPNPT